MQSFFIHCYWHLGSKCTHVVYLGECSQSEAKATFEATVKESDKFDLITLGDCSGHEVCRHSRVELKKPIQQPLLQKMRPWFTFFQIRFST